MASIPTAKVQYWALTPSASAQTNGPLQRIWADTAAGTIVVGSGDGSSVTLHIPLQTWVEFKYPVQIIGAASTATGLIAEGWGAPTTSGVAP